MLDMSHKRPERARGSDGRRKEQDLCYPFFAALQPESLEEVDYSSILAVRNLGSGSFGTVAQCVWRGTDSAIKTLLDPTRAAEFEKEVEREAKRGGEGKREEGFRKTRKTPVMKMKWVGRCALTVACSATRTLA